MSSRTDSVKQLAADLASQATEWAALAAEWSRLAAEWDQRAAAWTERAGGWAASTDERARHAGEEVQWAAGRAHEVAAWVRLAARDMLSLASRAP
jgi:hypothetical protein